MIGSAAELESTYRRRLRSLLYIPISIMTLIAVALGFLVQRQATIVNQTAASERTLAELNYLERRVIDSETGVRAFLLFGADDFLEPTIAAERALPASFHALDDERLEPEQREALLTAQSLFASWRSMTDEAVRQRRAGDDAALSVDRGRERKKTMDSIRALFETIRNRETARGNHLALTAERTTRITIAVTVALTVMVGALLATYVRREVRALTASYYEQVAALERQAAQLRELTATLERRVEERTKQWQQANQELEAFTYSVSHDLRAPLRHISGFSQLLKSTMAPSSDPKITHYLERITERTHEAGQLIDDLLAFSRTGRVDLVKSNVDTDALVRAVAQSVSAETDHAIVWTIEPLPAVFADASLLRIVFTNLLSNAVKYTRTRSEPRITVRAEQRGGATVFSVADNGVGFDMAYAGKLWGVFQRLHSSEEFEGTGIGLATVRRIVARHGGETWAESAPDQGATFSFSIPGVQA